MRQIWLKSKEHFKSIAALWSQKCFAAIQPNLPWPEGLRRKSLPVLSERLPVAPLRSAHSFAPISDFLQQRNALTLTNRA